MLDNEQQPVRQIAQGMDVCDVSGEKVGTVARVHHPAAAGEIIEVKTGLLGLGAHLYVQPGEIDAVTEAGLILKRAKHEFHDAGLDARPDNLTD